MAPDTSFQIIKLNYYFSMSMHYISDKWRLQDSSNQPTKSNLCIKPVQVHLCKYTKSIDREFISLGKINEEKCV